MNKKQELGKYRESVLKQIFDYCNHYDVDCHRHAGIFDVRSSAVNIWSRPWRKLEDKNISLLVGTIYVNWLTGEVSVEEKSEEPVARRVFFNVFHNIKNGHESTNPYAVFFTLLAVAETKLLEKEGIKCL